MRNIAIVVCLALVVSCASRRPAGPPVPPPIRSIAVVAGDPLSSAVGAELFNQGFKMFELPLNQDLSAKALQGLAGRGVDAVLVVKSRKGLDSFPDDASIRVLRTNGASAAVFDWSNSGTPRKNVADSARELVRTLQKTVPKP